jgi:hypothetical protein
VKGRAAGLIDTAGIAEVAKSLQWIAPVWSKSDDESIKSWMRQYTDWLLTSEIGKAEQDAKNNHGNWYDVQIVSMALYTGRTDLAKQTLEAAKSRRIAAQIEPDGRMPLELERTKALSYSTMSLRALFELASYGDQVGIDLWHFETKDGRSIRKALDFLAPYVDPGKKWPYPQIERFNRIELAALLHRAARVYKEPSYRELLQKLPPEELAAHRMHLK